MPEISISKRQRERLRAVQEALEAETPYGHVRPRDALEYLLDEYDSGDGVESLDAASAGAEASTEHAADVDSTATAADTQSEPPDGSTPDTTPDFEASDGQQGGPTVTRIPSQGTNGEGSGADADTDTDEAEEAAATDAASATDGDGSDEGTDGDGSDEGTDASDDETAAVAADTDGSDEGEEAGGDDSMLDSMMSLLDDHADKWDESGGGEEKYVVDLPDGTSEPARTKDDVRALLFKHYR